MQGGWTMFDRWSEYIGKPSAFHLWGFCVESQNIAECD